MLLTIAIPINYINHDCIYYKEIINNKILHNSTFCKLQYSNCNSTINGIPIFIELKHHPSHSKFKYIIHKYLNKQLINDIIQLEEFILLHYHCKKKPIYKLKDIIHKGVIKLNTEYPVSNYFIIKIAGIWETNSEYGLTFRISNHN